jgi:hypothetical protein
MCLPVELGVEEETEPSRWFGFDVELPLYDLVREGDFPSEVSTPQPIESGHAEAIRASS